jgi:hypothetical protein
MTLQIANRNVFEQDPSHVNGVCDNQRQTARNSLIQKWRDVRVVEGARLEIDSGRAQ